MLSGSLQQPDLLAREVIQNTVDAALRADGRGVARVVFRAASLVGEAKRRFVAAASLKDLAARSAVLRGLVSGNCLAALDDDTVPLRILTCEDEGTRGLDGKHDDPESAWFRFLLSLGDSGKTDEGAGHSGGSYGFGKTAISSASRLATIFAHTRYRDGAAERTRLMGCAYLDAFRADGVRHTGRAWLGKRRAGEGELVDPFEDGDADRLARALSLRERPPGDVGTTVLIVDPVGETTPEGILRAVETWWWPRLCAEQLDVVVIAEDGTERRPQPRLSRRLEPYIRCWTLATEKDAQPEEGHEMTRKFRPIDGCPLGTVALRALAPSEDDEETAEADWTDGVALIRFPKMVVAYHTAAGRSSTIPIAGVFLADDEADDILRMSEPPEHDRWEATNRRLQDDRAKEVVRAIHRRIRETIAEFRRRMRPPPPPDTAVADPLSRMLGDLFAPETTSRPGPEHASSPISIRFDQEPTLTPHPGPGRRLVMHARLRVALAAEQVDPLPVRVRFSCPILEEEQAGSESVALTVLGPDEEEGVHDEGGTVFRGTLRKGRAWRFDIRSEPYDAEWSVRLVPEVEVVEEVEVRP